MENDDRAREGAADANRATPPVQGRRQIDAEELLQGRTEICIRYNGQDYRLSTTRQGKLILTK